MTSSYGTPAVELDRSRRPRGAFDSASYVEDMASSWGRVAWIGALVALIALPRLKAQEALAGAGPPPAVASADPA